MSVSRLNPTGRFTGLACLYAQYRPTYPKAALDFIVDRCGLSSGSLLVDVGCGTGISSRLFAQRGISVLGIEPNAEMRRQAEMERMTPGLPPPRYIEGRAEATGLPDGAADAVLAAQAFHWFDSDPTLREFHRIIKPNGWAVLIWNERDQSDPFTAACGTIVSALPEAALAESYHGRGESLLASPLFQQGERVLFPNEQLLDENRFLGRVLSISYAPKDGLPADQYAEEMRKVFHRFQRGGQVVMHYETSVFVARRRA